MIGIREDNLSQAKNTAIEEVAVVSIYSPPEMIGIAKYTGEMCSHLTAEGYAVKLITASPYYPQWRVWPGYSNKSYRRFKLDGVDYSTCPYWLPNKITGLKKMLHLLSFSITSMPLIASFVIRRRQALICIVYPYIFLTPITIILSKIFFSNTKVWIHIQDFELDAAFDLGLVKNKWLQRFGAFTERKTLQHADYVSTISDNMMHRLSDKGVDRSKMFYFPNWVDTAKIIPLEAGQVSKYRKEWELEADLCVALYSGNLGDKQGLDLLVDSAKLLQNENVMFVIVGDGSNKAKLMEQAEGLSNMIFKDLVPEEDLNELLNLADIHLLPQAEGVTDLVLPSKLLGMLSSQKPVVCTAFSDSQLGKILGNCGIVVAPGDVGEFASGIASLVHDKAKRLRFGSLGRELVVSKWGKESVLSSLNDFIRLAS